MKRNVSRHQQRRQPTINLTEGGCGCFPWTYPGGCRQHAVADAAVHRYRGPKKPEMPVQMAKRASVASTHNIIGSPDCATHEKSTYIADFDFLKRVASEENVPEFVDYTT